MTCFKLSYNAAPLVWTRLTVSRSHTRGAALYDNLKQRAIQNSLCKQSDLVYHLQVEVLSFMEDELKKKGNIFPMQKAENKYL